MTTNDYVQKELSNNTFESEKAITSMVTYSWNEHEEKALLLEEGKELLLKGIQQMYPNSSVVLARSHPDASQGYSVDITVEKKS